MNSFALWLSPKSESKGDQDNILEVETHFNLWYCYSQKHKLPSLDVGVMVSDYSNVGCINIYLPFKFKSGVIDLGCKISADNKIISSVFNDNFTITPDNKQVEARKDSVTKFIIYKLDTAIDVKSEDYADGTLLKITTVNIQMNSLVKKYYFRIRVTCSGLEDIIVNKIKSDFVLASAFETDSFIDFRFNDYRTLPETVVENMTKNYMGETITKIHFFLMTKANIDIGSVNILDQRQLEKNIWNKYIDDIDTKTIIMASHWKSTNEKLKDKEGQEIYKQKNINFILYIRFKNVYCNIGTILLGIIFIFGLNLISSLAFDKMNNKLATKWNWIISTSVMILPFIIWYIIKGFKELIKCLRRGKK